MLPRDGPTYYSGIIGAGEELCSIDDCKAPNTVLVPQIRGAQLRMGHAK